MPGSIPIPALSTPVKATLLMIGAMTCFSLMGVFIRLSAEQLDSLEIVFFRNSLAFLLMVPWILSQGVSVMKTRRWGLYSLRAIINVFGMAAGFAAFTMIPLAEATALTFTTPLWATIGAVLVLGEVIRARRITALAIGFIGMLVILQPGVGEISLGALLALVNAFLIAGTALIVKKLTETERPEAIVTWMVLMQTPLSLIPALFVWEWPSLMTWVWLWGLAGAGTVGHVCWTRACGLAEITSLQPFEFVKLPVIALLGFLIFGEVPSELTWVGGAVIFASTAYITHREAQLAKRTSDQR